MLSRCHGGNLIGKRTRGNIAYISLKRVVSRFVRSCVELRVRKVRGNAWRSEMRNSGRNVGVAMSRGTLGWNGNIRLV